MLSLTLDLINYERISNVLIHHNLYDLFVELVKVCQMSHLKTESDNLVSSMFVTVLNRNDEAKMLHIVTLYESILLQKAAKVVPAIISHLQ